MATYNYRAGAHYKPTSFTEMLVPLNMYKQAYDETEAAYADMADKADTFSYLQKVAEENPDSKAAQLYNNFAKDMHYYFDDFAKHGVSINNRKGLTQLKRRVKSEIGRLEKADTALQNAKKSYLEKLSKDPTTMFATKEFRIDDYLDENMPNQYSISGQDIYARGLNIGKNLSQSIFHSGEAGDVMKGQYIKWMESRGIPLWDRAAFMDSDLVKTLAQNTLAEKGVFDNLDTVDQAKSLQAIMNGIYEGLTYEENVKPYKDDTRMTAYQAASLNLQKENRDFEREVSGYEKIDGHWAFNPGKSQKVAEAAAVAAARKSNGNGKSSETIEIEQLPATIFDQNGVARTAPSGGDKTKGTLVSWDEALRINDKLGNYPALTKHPNDYYYYHNRNNNNIWVEPIQRIKRTTTPTSSVSSTVIEEGEGDGNQS